MSDYTALVVEDSPTMRQLLVSVLNELSELEVLEAEDGVDGLRRLRERKVDILITDINMPMMDGLKLVGMVRKDPNHRDIPIIIVTTEGAKEDRERGMALGADAYFVKPVQPSVVVATVSELLGM
jgi:two-component system chemotaxis response regulator CheY